MEEKLYYYVFRYMRSDVDDGRYSIVAAGPEYEDPDPSDRNPRNIYGRFNTREEAEDYIRSKS